MKQRFSDSQINSKKHVISVLYPAKLTRKQKRLRDAAGQKSRNLVFMICPQGVHQNKTVASLCLCKPRHPVWERENKQYIVQPADELGVAVSTQELSDKNMYFLVLTTEEM